jgi:hypothetical protein
MHEKANERNNLFVLIPKSMTFGVRQTEVKISDFLSTGIPDLVKFVSFSKSQGSHMQKGRNLLFIYLVAIFTFLVYCTGPPSITAL